MLLCVSVYPAADGPGLCPVPCLPRRTPPCPAAAIAGAVGGVIKQNRINPVPKGGPDAPPDEKKQGGSAVLAAWLLAAFQPPLAASRAGARTASPRPSTLSSLSLLRLPLTGSKNIMRGAFLAFLATFCGCICFYTLPDFVASQLGRVMPFWFYEGQVRGETSGDASLLLLFELPVDAASGCLCCTRPGQALRASRLTLDTLHTRSAEHAAGDRHGRVQLPVHRLHDLGRKHGTACTSCSAQHSTERGSWQGRRRPPRHPSPCCLRLVPHPSVLLLSSRPPRSTPSTPPLFSSRLFAAPAHCCPLPCSHPP